MIHGSGGLDARAVTVILAVMLAQPHMLEDGRCDGEVVVEEFQGCRSTGSQPHRAGLLQRASCSRRVERDVQEIRRRDTVPGHAGQLAHFDESATIVFSLTLNPEGHECTLRLPTQGLARSM
jgi:hypothetical protein